MPLFSKNGKTLLFLHIPKTAGTSITFFFMRNGFCVDWFSSSFNARAGISSPQHRDRNTVLRYLAEERIQYDSSFTLVRNPLDRLVSEYFQQCRNRDALSIKLTRRGFFNRPYTSRGFSYWTEKVFELNDTQPVLFDNHLRPQTDFLLDDTVVLRFENGLAAFVDYAKILDASHDFGFDFKRLSQYNKSQNRVAFSIDRRTMQRILDYYRADFERFYPRQATDFSPQVPSSTDLSAPASF